ncbi:MAG: TetR family transcriptional regulator [Burkholderiales bacterium]|nr:TetR family transcriptional regulator [Burkholderiales bacterium]
MVRRTKEEADATRQALLDAAEHVFYEKGVGRASLAEIAQAAGATRGAIYWHFRDKVDLFNAMMDRVTLPLEAAYDADEAARGDPLQRVRVAVCAVFSAVVGDTHARRVFEIAMYRVEYVAELNGVRERHQAAMQRCHAMLTRDLALAARQARVALPMPAAEAALGLQALFDGLLQGWILTGAPFDPLAVGRRTMDVYLSGLGFAPQGA